MKTKTVIATCIGLVAAACLGGLGVIYSGVVEVSATGREPAALRWLLVTTREQSIARRVADIEVPDLGTPSQIRAGLEHYQAMCQDCHGAPGIDPSELAQGLNPKPPHFDGTGSELNDTQLATGFWVIRNGIRMTGMPAFGPTHDDETIWSIVALLEALPDMTAEAYQKRLDELGTSAKAEAAHHGSHDHGGARHDEAGSAHVEDATKREPEHDDHAEHDHGAEAPRTEPEQPAPSDHDSHGAHEHQH